MFLCAAKVFALHVRRIMCSCVYKMCTRLAVFSPLFDISERFRAHGNTALNLYTVRIMSTVTCNEEYRTRKHSYWRLFSFFWHGGYWKCYRSTCFNWKTFNYKKTARIYFPCIWFYLCNCTIKFVMATRIRFLHAQIRLDNLILIQNLIFIKN